MNGKLIIGGICVFVLALSWGFTCNPTGIPSLIGMAVLGGLGISLIMNGIIGMIKRRS